MPSPRALALARDPDAVARPEQTRATVRDQFGIGTMAQALERVYAAVADAAAGAGHARRPALHGAAR